MFSIPKFATKIIGRITGRVFDLQNGGLPQNGAIEVGGIIGWNKV